MRVTSFAALIAAAGLMVVAAGGCGGSDKPPALSDGSGRSPSQVEPGQGFDFDASTAAPSCDGGASNGVCGCLDLTLLQDVPNLYFVLDRSGSMNEGDKWTSVRIVVADVARRLGPRARFGAAIFPGPQGRCSEGAEVMPVTAGDAPAGTLGPTTLGLLTATNEPASGGTPTTATLRALTPRITSLKGRTFVILATDGGPNCSEVSSCDVSACMPNIEGASEQCQPNGPVNCCGGSGGAEGCLDGAALIAAVSGLKAANVPTYVVGVPGTAPYGALLDRVAEAGGTARDEAPRYYRVDTNDRALLGATLAKIAAKITATCDLPLSAVPDPARVNVYLDDTVVPQDPDNGWRLEGLTVKLVGTTCERVLAGEALNVRVVAGCPTVPPK